MPLGEQGHGLALVPYADLLDHDPSAHIAWHAGFSGHDDFQMVTFSPIAKAGRVKQPAPLVLQILLCHISALIV